MKMIVTDLDGTLLRNDKTISFRTQKILTQCRQKGIKTVYATGRGDTALLVAPSDLFDGCIRMNGAIAMAQQKTIHNKKFAVEYVRKLLLELISKGYKVAVEDGNTHYSNFDVTAQWANIDKFEYVDFATFDMNVEKAYVVIEKPSDRDLVRSLLPQDLFIYFMENELALISHKDAIKSKAIDALAFYWGINTRDIIAFGDGENDIDMIKHCGTGIAMSNALDEVKFFADDTCDTNENDGVARWIEENVLTDN